MMKELYPFSQFLGVDVFKDKLNFGFADGKKTWSIKNSPSAITSGQIAKLVGVAPMNRDSGKKTGQRRTFGGRETADDRQCPDQRRPVME